MNKKFTLILAIAIVAVIGLSAAYAITENNTTLSIKSEPPVHIGEMTNTIEVQPFFKNYNSTTLNWLKEFSSDYVVFPTTDYYIIMNSTDATKISENATTGISIKNNITCNVLENKTLGKGLNNILYVENVEVISEDVEKIVFN